MREAEEASLDPIRRLTEKARYADKRPEGKTSESVSDMGSETMHLLSARCGPSGPSTKGPTRIVARAFNQSISVITRQHARSSMPLS